MVSPIAAGVDRSHEWVRDTLWPVSHGSLRRDMNGIQGTVVNYLDPSQQGVAMDLHDLQEDDKAAAEQQAGADHQPTFSLPAYSPRPHAPSPPPHPSLQQPPPGPAALRGASPQTTPHTVPRPKSQPHQGPRADASPATPLRRLSGSGSGAPASAASRLSKVSCPPTVTASALPGGSSAAAAAGGSVGGQYARGAAAPVPLPAAVRSNMLHRVSAAGMLHRQSVPVGPSAAFPALQRPSAPCSPYSHAGLLGDAAAVGAGAQPGTSGRDKARPGGLPEERPSPQELQRRSGLSRMSMKGRLTMMADVMLGTDYLERSAQVSAPHGGTQPPRPCVLAPSTFSHGSVNGAHHKSDFAEARSSLVPQVGPDARAGGSASHARSISRGAVGSEFDMCRCVDLWRCHSSPECHLLRSGPVNHQVVHPCGPTPGWTHAGAFIVSSSHPALPRPDTPFAGRGSCRPLCVCQLPNVC